jgi:hypothetical protein
MVEGRHPLVGITFNSVYPPRMHTVASSTRAGDA